MLNEKVSPQTLGFARIWIYALWFRKIYIDPFYQLAELPIEIFSPIGVMRLIPESLYGYICTAPVLGALKVIMLVGLALLVLGVGPYRRIAIFTCALLTFHQGLVRGFGDISDIPHGELGMLYAAYVLAVFPAADAFSLRRGRVKYAQPVMYAAPMMAIAFMISLAYAFIGTRRLAASAPAIFLDGSILRYVALRSAQDGAFRHEYGLLALEQPWLALLLQIGFPIITVLEGLTPLGLISRRFRWVWLVVMVPFHCLTLYLMKIFFLYNILLLLVFFTGIDRLFAPLTAAPSLQVERENEKTPHKRKRA